MQSLDATNGSAGVNQHGVRDYNERLIVTMIQRNGPLPGSEIAKMCGLSPQTVSVILRGLEAQGILTKGEPQRGRVGKPSIPMAFASNAAFAIGLKVGRRTADFVLIDIHGRIRFERQLTYAYPRHDSIMDFFHPTYEAALMHLGDTDAQRVVGVGIAMPYEIWNWHESIGAPDGALNAWQDFDLVTEVARFTDLPIFVENDATAACRSELAFGRGRDLQHFAYFFLGSFVGGGIVLNGAVLDGISGNAGAFGSLPASLAGDPDGQLIDAASIHLLEEKLARIGVSAEQLWSMPLDWSGFEMAVGEWIDETARHIARAALTVCAVIDFGHIVIDGAFPRQVGTRLVSRTQDLISTLDCRGVRQPVIEMGSVGPNARALGASTAPIASSFLLSQTMFGAHASQR